MVSIRDYGMGMPGRAAVILRMATVFCLLLGQQALAEDAGEGYTPTSLVSNILGRAAGSSDSSLVNCWGIAADTRGGPWWVADEGKGKATVYSKAGAAFPFLGPFSVTVPVVPGGINDYSTPMGIVYNGGADFDLAPGVPSRFIFVTRDGSIAGWNREQDAYEAVVVQDNSPEAVYTGAAIASMKNKDGRDVLYVANFGQGRIDAFGPDFDPLALGAGAFTDPDLPDGFSPYNVQNIDGELWITFAMAGPDGRTAVPGRGLGYVDVFDASGVLLMRVEHGPWFDAPWGIAMAPPAGFGTYNGSVLVGNSGSGRIAAFDAASGSYLGLLKDGKDDPIAVPDLHGLSFGNGGFAGPATTLYFTAGSRGGLNLFGAISSGSTPGTGVVIPSAGAVSGY